MCIRDSKYIKALLEEIFYKNEYIKNRFVSHSAAKSIHHSYMGGLVAVSYTHLMSDSHYLIEKNVCENKTITSVQTLNVDGSIREISRLMGGAEMTETTFKAAKEMKEMAQKMKVKM